MAGQCCRPKISVVTGISVFPISGSGKLCRIGTFENEEQVILTETMAAALYLSSGKGKIDQLDKAAAILVF